MQLNANFLMAYAHMIITLCRMRHLAATVSILTLMQVKIRFYYHFYTYLLLLFFCSLCCSNFSCIHFQHLVADIASHFDPCHHHHNRHNTTSDNQDMPYNEGILTAVSN